MSSLPPPPPPGGSPFPPAPPLPPGTYHPPPSPGGYGAPPSPPPPGPWQRTGFEYAGFWNRVGARLLDALLGLAVMAPFVIPAIVLVVNGVGDCRRYRFVDGGFRRECAEWEIDQPGLIALGVVIGLAGLALWVVLYIRWWAKGQTPGMKAAGTRLVRVGTLQPIGIGRATGRFFASYLSSWVCYLGFLWMLWDPQKRTWHDMMCETIVVKA